jgi:hypothetical protein
VVTSSAVQLSGGIDRSHRLPKPPSTLMSSDAARGSILLDTLRTRPDKRDNPHFRPCAVRIWTQIPSGVAAGFEEIGRYLAATARGKQIICWRKSPPAQPPDVVRPAPAVAGHKARRLVTAVQPTLFDYLNAHIT